MVSDQCIGLVNFVGKSGGCLGESSPVPPSHERCSMNSLAPVLERSVEAILPFPMECGLSPFLNICISVLFCVVLICDVCLYDFVNPQKLKEKCACQRTTCCQCRT